MNTPSRRRKPLGVPGEDRGARPVESLREIERLKRAEKALQETEERFRQMFDNMSSGVAVYEAVRDGEDFIFKDFNRAAERIEGTRREDVIGRSVLQVFPGVRALGLFDVFQRVWRDGVPVHHPTGLYRDERVVGWRENYVYRLPSGEVVAIYDDVTERKRAEEALSRVNRSLRVISECNQAVVRAVEESELLRNICRILMEIGGYRLAWIGFAENDDGKRVRPAAQAGFEEGYLATLDITWADTERGRGPTGTAVRTGQPVICLNMLTDPRFLPWREEAVRRGYQSSIAVPLFAEGRALGALSIYSGQPEAFDVEEVGLLSEMAGDLAFGIMTLRARILHAEAETALEHTKQRLEALVRGAPVPIIALDCAARVTSWNPAAERTYGWPSAEATGMFLPVVPKDLRDSFMHWYRRILEGHPFSGFETRNVRKDGSEILVSVSAARLYDLKGQVSGTIGVNVDITDRKRAESELRDTNRRLEDALAELQRTQQQVIQQERLQALGQMVSGIAHDFNNVLMPIVGLSDLLLSDQEILAGRDEARACVEDIQAAAEDARNIVRRLREFYHPEEPLDAQPICMEDLVARVLALTRPAWRTQAQAEGRTIRVETDFAGFPTLMANESQLREVLTNLVFNAVDAMPNGGVVRLSGVPQGDWALVKVSDTGVGMTEEVRRRCIEPFFSTKGERGTGLGLSVCHGIVKRHGGTLDIESEPGKGTTVTVCLPLKPSGAAPNGAPASAKRESQQGVRVLVIDDQEESRHVLSRYLVLEGHTAETAETGQEGVEKLRAGRYDLVMTDRSMPGMSGDEVARAVKEFSPATPVIMLTGFGDMMKHRMESPGDVDAVLGKPCTLRELREAIGSVLRR